MANTIQLRILDSKQIIAEMSGMPLASENSYRIIAGEENATEFEIVQKPSAYENATYYVYFINSLGERAFLGDVIPDPLTNDGQEIVNDTFVLPKGMAVAGYGYIRIYCLYNDEKVEFQRIKVKIWETVPTYHNYVRPLETIATEEWVEELFAKKNGTYPQLNAGHASTADEAENAEYLLVDGTPRNGVYFKNLIDGKVQSNTTDTTSDGSVYVSKANGGVKNDVMIPIGNSEGNIVKRNASGNLTTGTPVSPGEATNKAYVDNQLIGLEGVVVFKSQIGQANGVAPLDANGKLPAGLVPSIELKDYIQVSSEAELQTINAQIGDVAYLAETIDGKLTVTNSWWFVDIDTTQEPPFRIWAVLNTVYAENALLAQKANALMVSGNPKSGTDIQSDIDSKIPKANIDTRIPVTPLDTNVPSTKLLNDTVEGVKNALENGTLVPAKSLTTKQVENLSEDSGSTQTDPFIFQATGTNNNTSLTPTAPVAKQLELRANSVVVNQQVPSVTGKTITDTSTGWTLDYVIGDSIINTSHIYLLVVKISAKSSNMNVRIRYPYLSNNLNVGTSIFLVTSPNLTTFALQHQSADGNEASYSVPDNYAKAIDLTQWFGSNDNIPSDLLSHPETWYNYDNTDGSYNTGTIVDTNADELECIEKNQWDEQWELGAINTITGANEPSTTQIRAKNYIRVIPNTEYYFYNSNQYDRIYFYDRDNNFISTQTLPTSKFTTPSNCFFVKFMMRGSYGTTYNHDISIYIVYWKNPNDHSQGMDGDHYTTYTPYKKHTYALTPLDKPYSVSPSVYNYRSANGLETDKVDRVKLKDLTWSYVTSGSVYAPYFAAKLNGGKTPTNEDMNNSVKYNAICANYEIVPRNSTKFIDKTMTVDNPTFAQLQVRDSSYTDATTFTNHFTDDDYIYFELATPTTTQGDAFAENVIVDDYGTMAFKKNGSYVTTPQGNRFFYPVDYVKLMDDLNNYTSGDVTTLAKKSDVDDTALNARGYYKMQDLSASITDVAGLTYTVKKAYKCGNVVNITIFATNNTGSTINKATTLATLSSGMYNVLRTLVMPCVYYVNSQDQNNNACCMVSSSGNLSILENFNNGDSITITITLSVA